MEPTAHPTDTIMELLMNTFGSTNLVISARTDALSFFYLTGTAAMASSDSSAFYFDVVLELFLSPAIVI